MGKGEMKFSTYERSTNLIRTRFKNLSTKVQAIVEASSQAPLTAVQSRLLTTYLAEIKRKRLDFENNFQRILESASDEDIAAANLEQDQDDINDSYVLLVSQIEALLPAEEAKTPSAHSEMSFTHVQATPQNVRLPQLDLKTFHGESSQWTSFISLYDATVHHNVSLSSVVKMQYLLSCLSGEPLNLVKSLSISSANYVIAYDILRERYQNNRRLTALHLNAILDLPAITSGQTRALRNFLNLFTEHTQSLAALQCDITTQNNPLLAAHILRRMDQDLRRKLEIFRSKQECEIHSLPTVDHIIKFLNEECSQTEDASLHFSQTQKPSTSSSKPQKSVRFTEPKPHSTNRQVSLVSTQASTSGVTGSHPALPCFVCNQTSHKVYKCPVFLGKSPQERSQLVKSKNRCYSCLGSHLVDKCGSTKSCFTCQRKHHTLLHFERKPSAAPPPSNSQQTQQADLIVASAQRSNAAPQTLSSTVLLGTALVKLTAPDGTMHVFRALLDSGSQLDFVSERAAQLLGAPRQKSTLAISGISSTSARTKGQVQLSLASLSDQHIASHHSFHILDKISAALPSAQLSQEVLKLTRPYLLADPTFHLPGPIDVLLGGSLFPLFFTQHNHSLGDNLPHMMGTKFGFIVMGNAPCDLVTSQSTYFASLLSTSEYDLHSSLQKFWTQEEPPTASRKSAEEQLCDQHFTRTHSRTPEGRYVVQLPVKPDSPSLGHSQQIAEKRFFSLERKFQTQPHFYKLYVEFMKNCENSQHMIKVTDPDLPPQHCFLPHHGVLKHSGDSTKLRVVYDASCSTSSGVSLNDTLLTGPKLQNHICDLLLRFRTHKIVFTCDIRQMYLQILVQPPDQNLQLVLWRETPSEPLDTYKLTRVTFGVNSSPYLAIRTLHQLADDEGHAFPEAAQILRSQTYVDDIIAGADSVEEAKKLQDQLIELLGKGGFELRKWVSNAPELLQALPEAHIETPVFLEDQPLFSILGLHWNLASDSFTYNLRLPCDTPTKRHVLSLIAKIYDPCGFLSPCIMTAKCFMQLLWTSGLGWDEPLPSDLAERWQTYVASVQSLTDISIPRAFQLSSTLNLQVHGFSDASESGYAAVVFFRCEQPSGDVIIRQILAKTRVAPLKKVTLPRLELCGAHLLAQLVSYCNSIFEDIVNFRQCHLWCDSAVALSWLQTPSYRLKTYVANRVAQTQEMIPSHCWRYVPSKDNPADCASRGILASELVDHPLWWTGPNWLSLPPSCWPNNSFTPVDTMDTGEEKATPLTVLVSHSVPEWDFLSNFSSWTTLVRVTAYMLRFTHNLRSPDRCQGPLSAHELKNATFRLFKLVQVSSFTEDFTSLQKATPCSSRLRRLAPFIDDQGLIRVGGRLQKANLPYDSKHSIVLPKRHHVVDLFIDYVHRKHLHSGPQLTQAILAESVWILSARSAVRTRLFKCLTCFRHKPRNQAPFMGNLPAARVTPARPFHSTGIDYGGPFLAKAHTLRSVKHIKVYICVMVCFATKAVHIEMVTDLTTGAFLAALTRFVSRRGLCTDIYSDCGTNFVGANAELKGIQKNLNTPTAQQEIVNFAAQRGINFHFNPPAAPHQGGLWEAAIKSAKHHLKRVIGDQVLTFAEFSTLTTQVEAMLNSRPLTPLSNDPSDYSALTPGHFLIGSSLTAVPETSLLDVSTSRLKSWRLVQALSQHLWRRWQQEYIHTLQQRGKWTSSTKNLEPGDLVLVQQPTPPLSWPLARILEVFPGADGTVRVVKLKTQSAVFSRPAVKVFPLPID